MDERSRPRPGLLTRFASTLAARRLRPVALVVVIVLALVAVLWGALVSKPQFTVSSYDAGPLDQFAVGRLVPFEESGLYVFGLDDGRLRVLDGVVRATGCRVHWLPEDRRAESENPDRTPGAFLDPCSGAIWAIDGDAVSGTSAPLRTFIATVSEDASGVLHVYVEVIGRDAGGGSAGR
ncbi:MAG: hypothetical protein QF664_11330 [Dehalococcoidia bacterium]|nr:hypothetical protein [Dehalococcoidia bacterium]